MASTSSRQGAMPLRSPSNAAAGGTTAGGGSSTRATAATSSGTLPLDSNNGTIPSSPSFSATMGPASTARLSSAEVRNLASKLQHENQSLKRRLRKYASTLTELSGHAKREIASSARARDSAIAAAADAAALRQTVQDMTMNKDRLERSVRDAHAQLTERNASLARMTEDSTRLRSRVSDADSERAALRDARDSHANVERRAVAAEAECRARAERISALEIRVKEAGDRIVAAERLSRELADAARGKEDLVTRAERASREVAAASQKDVHQRAHITRLKEDVSRLEGDCKTLRDVADERGRSLAAAEERSRLSERDVGNAERRMRENEEKMNETIIALRKELDGAMRESAERAAQLTEARNNHARQVKAASEDIVSERDQLRVTVREQQEEIDQSAELLTRAAVDALADKGKIRKLEDALSKAREQMASERQERVSREARISALVEEVSSYEAQVDDLRAVKRTMTDELHGMQLTLHEKEKTVATKARELEEIGTERNDRAFHADRLGLELSNAKNALAKKESDYLQLSSEYNEVSEQLKSTAKDVEKLDVEIGISRRELSRANDQLTNALQERDRLKGSAEELVLARKQVADMTAQIAERDEEVGTLRRWYASVKSEVAESAREKKRLSDMLSDVSSDLQRSNHELDLLREMRKDQDELSQRISAVSEQSTRELHVLKQVQTEQAERLARNTVDEYQRRMEAIQMATRDEIANSVTAQLRHDIMPHLIRVVDSKSRNMVRALARHVESFSLEDGGMHEHATLMDGSENKTMNGTTDADLDDTSPSLSNVHTNVATASGSTASRGNVGLPSSTAASGSEFAYRAEVPSTAPFLDASRIDSVGSRHDMDDVDVDVDVPLSAPSRTETPTEGQSEIVDNYEYHAHSFSRSAVVPPVATSEPDVSENRSAAVGDTQGGLGDEKDEEEEVDEKEDIDAGGAVGVDEGRSEGANTAEVAAELFSERDVLADGYQTQEEEESCIKEEDQEAPRGEDDVEELDITDHVNADDEDDEDGGLEIELEYDPRDLQGVFSKLVVESDEEDNIGIGISIGGHADEEYDDDYDPLKHEEGEDSDGEDQDEGENIRSQELADLGHEERDHMGDSNIGIGTSIGGHGDEEDDNDYDPTEYKDGEDSDEADHDEEEDIEPRELPDLGREEGDSMKENAREVEASHNLGDLAVSEEGIYADDEEEAGPRDLSKVGLDVSGPSSMEAEGEGSASQNMSDLGGLADDEGGPGEGDASRDLSAVGEDDGRDDNDLGRGMGNLQQPIDEQLTDSGLGVDKDDEPIEQARDYKYERNFTSGDDDGIDNDDEDGVDDNHHIEDDEFRTPEDEERLESVQQYVASLRAAGALNQAGPSSIPPMHTQTTFYEDNDQGDGVYERDSTPVVGDDNDTMDDEADHHDEDDDGDDLHDDHDGDRAFGPHSVHVPHVDQGQDAPGSLYHDERYMADVDQQVGLHPAGEGHDDVHAVYDDDAEDRHHQSGTGMDDDMIEPSSAGLGLGGLSSVGVGAGVDMHEDYDDEQLSSAEYAEAMEARDEDDEERRHGGEGVDDDDDDDMAEPTTGPEVPVPVPVPVPAMARTDTGSVMYVPDSLFSGHSSDIDATKEVLDAQLMEPSSEHEKDGDGDGDGHRSAATAGTVGTASASVSASASGAGSTQGMNTPAVSESRTHASV